MSRWRARTRIGNRTRRGVSPKVVHLNYAHHAFRKAQRHNTASAKQHGAHVFTDYVQMGFKDLDAEFRKQNASLLSQERGAGYWCWKPQIIWQVMSDMTEGDRLFYTDSGSSFVANPSPLLALVDAQPVAGFYLMGNTVGMWTKRDVIRAYDAEPLRDSLQVAGTYLVWVKSSESMDLLAEWARACRTPRLVDDSPSVSENFPEFREHRHDQALFTVISRTNGIEAYPDPSQDGDSVNTIRREQHGYELVIHSHRKRW